MGIVNGLLRLVTWWNGQTIGTQIFTARKGVKVGEDDQGNVYYTTRDGGRRWVIYNGEVEASRISADWHGWLHHTFDQPPTEAPPCAQVVGTTPFREPDRYPRWPMRLRARCVVPIRWNAAITRLGSRNKGPFRWLKTRQRWL